MITGGVYNNGINAGTQAGVVITGGTFVQGHFAVGPMVNGYVVNNGLNLFGQQAGVVVTGGTFWHL